MAGTQQADQESITGINVTPLVDVMLVLLIIFMATAPLLQRRAIHVNVPKAAKAERQATETTRIEFNEKKQILLDGKPLIKADLANELKIMVSREPALHVALAADQTIPYGDVVELLDLVKGAGVKRIGLDVRNK
jgi:biopolymer transport protein ExbD